MAAPACADVSGWGRLSFRGPDRVKALQGLVSADLRALKPGAGLPSCVLTPKGKYVADFMLYDLGEELLTVQFPQATARIQEALKKPLMLTDTAMTEVSGPAWLVFGPGEGLPFPRFGVPAVLRLGGKRPDLPAMAPEALEALRIEAGLPIPGVDTDEEALPLEIPALEAAISFDKGCFMGQETTARMKNFGHANRRLEVVRRGARAGLEMVRLRP
jgi:hypothetical protein